MSFRDRERQKAVKYRDAIFRDPGSGIFFGKERDFVLQEQGRELHEVWTKVLKQSQKYIQIDPSSLLKGFDSIADTKSWLTYLERRYW